MTLRLVRVKHESVVNTRDYIQRTGNIEFSGVFHALEACELKYKP